MTIHRIINSEGRDDLLEKKGMLKAYHKVLLTITAEVREKDND